MAGRDRGGRKRKEGERERPREGGMEGEKREGSIHKPRHVPSAPASQTLAASLHACVSLPLHAAAAAFLTPATAPARQITLLFPPLCLRPSLLYPLQALSSSIKLSPLRNPFLGRPRGHDTLFYQRVCQSEHSRGASPHPPPLPGHHPPTTTLAPPHHQHHLHLRQHRRRTLELLRNFMETVPL